jgi:hypothetical protein
MVRAVKLTLVGVQSRQLAEESPAAGMMPQAFGMGWIPEAIGVFTADLSGDMPSQWRVQAAHIRNLLDLEVASGTYDMVTGNLKPLEQLADIFSLGLREEEGPGTSLIFRAAAHLEYAATSALNIAQRSASWLTRKALRFQHHVSIQRFDEDDAVSFSGLSLFTLFGGMSFSVSIDVVAGNVLFSRGGLNVLYIVADLTQPLDRNLRATLVRIPAAKTKGEFDVHRPFVTSYAWRDGNFHIGCKMLSLDCAGMLSEGDLSEMFEKLEVSPGGGLLSDGAVTIRVGQSVV